MTGPTASLSVAIALPGASALPSLLNVGAPAVAPGGVPGAVPSLTAFVDLMIGQPQPAPATVALADNRQDDAAPGNALPDGKEDETTDPALAWLLAAPVLTTPAPTAPIVAAGGPAVSVKLDTDVQARLTPPPLALPIDPRSAPDPVPQPDTVAVAADANANANANAAATPSTPELTPAKPAAPIVVTTPAVGASIAATLSAEPKDAPQPDVTPVDTPMRAADAPSVRATPVAQPSAQAIAAAMLRTPQAQPVTLARVLAANSAAQPALFALGMDRSSDDTEAKPLSPAATAASLLTPTDAAALIAKPGEAQRQALDMGRQDWPQKMIDRIETLRDNANANDTSIRLKPEALGRIDVSLRTQADGAVSVRFTAEQPTTRALLTDAAPQLTAAAEARGIRLSQTSVDLSGSGQGNERQRPQFELQQNISNRLAAGGEADIQAVTDGRIA